jgi:hypothetical protein
MLRPKPDIRLGSRIELLETFLALPKLLGHRKILTKSGRKPP